MCSPGRGILTGATQKVPNGCTEITATPESPAVGCSSLEGSHPVGLRACSTPSLEALAEVAALEQGGLKDNEREERANNRKSEPNSPYVYTYKKSVDQRRIVVMKLFQNHGYFPADNITTAFQQQHADLFPSKAALQLKIREVRQRIMHSGSNK